EKLHRPIRTLEEWQVYAGPKRVDHWVPGRSAYETAREWLGNGSSPSLPGAIRELFDSCELTRGFEAEVVYPELQIRFDEFSGEPRNADLAIAGNAGKRKVAVTIEAKADEAFSNVLAKEMGAARRTKQSNPSSRKQDRIEGLVSGILGLPPARFQEVEDLRYQLFTGVAGTLTWARETSAEPAVFLVHVFETGKTQRKHLDRNEADFSEFVHALDHQNPSPVLPGRLHGPYLLPGFGRYAQPVPLLIGKVMSNVG
ncbi:MAG: hypothetical protein WBE58_19925, partial [Verrucomicrobiales bacterium]